MVDPDLVTSALCNRCKVARNTDRGVVADTGSRVVSRMVEQTAPGMDGSATVQVNS
jgi:hypothetical protein